jgi:glucokinase
VILAGDLGGTKTVLAICDDRDFAIAREAVYPCADYPSLEAILDAFLHPADLKGLTAACIGVAGPIVGNTSEITNLPWKIDGHAVSTKLGGIPVTLINDLQATALGTLILPDAAFAMLQPPAAPAPHGPVAVIAPGTGLGTSLLVSDGTHYRALASEGGHADFAPGTDEEIELLRFMRARHGGHVSVERVLSGAGIGDIYDFVRTTATAGEPAWLTQQLTHGDRNAAVSKAALDRTDPSAIHAIEMFVEMLGAESSNLALRGLTTGGVVLGGGIPPKLLPALQHPRFIDRFNAKGRFSRWTRGLAVRVALEPRAALFGAAHYAATHKDSRS